ncbi:MAG: hypothetical protein EBT75_08250, partial [Proteobacteria bacterium]|nr:hypothetical protein [Pseudomonadota bacterium]
IHYFPNPIRQKRFALLLWKVGGGMWKESFELTSCDFLPPSTSIRIIGPPGYLLLVSGRQ